MYSVYNLILPSYIPIVFSGNSFAPKHLARLSAYFAPKHLARLSACFQVAERSLYDI